MRRTQGRSRAGTWAVRVTAVALATWFAGFGAWLIFDSLVGLPTEYAYLLRSGQPALARITVCEAGVGGGRGIGCEATYVYAGVPYHGTVPFMGERVPSGTGVAVLVDPRQPRTFYRESDVRSGTNTGFGGPGILGVAFVVLGGAFAALLVWIEARGAALRRHR